MLNLKVNRGAIMPGFEIGDKHIHYRVRDPSLFKKETYKTLDLRKGIKHRSARLKANNRWAIQSVLFDKKEFTIEEAKEWVRAHSSLFMIEINDSWVSKYVEGEKKMSLSGEEEQFAKWDTAFINDLPDSSFAYIEKGGEKDEEGKTKPRSLRHLPYKNKEGKIDLPHVRNALARLNQVKKSDGSKLSQDEQDRIRNHLQKALESAKEMLSSLSGSEPMIEIFSGSNVKEFDGLGNDAFKMVEVGNLVKETDDQTSQKLLKLNEELIEALKQSNTEIDQLKESNKQIGIELSDNKIKIEAFSAKEKAKEIEQFNQELDITIKDYCAFFGLESVDEITETREQMSKYSEDMLKRTRDLISKRRTLEYKKPESITEPSTNLRNETEIEIVNGFAEVPKEKFEAFNNKEKTKYLYDKLKAYHNLG